MELGQGLRFVLRVLQYFTSRKRFSRARCRFLLPVLAVLGILHVTWMCLAVNRGIVAVGDPDGLRRLFWSGNQHDSEVPAAVHPNSAQDASSSIRGKKCKQGICGPENPPSLSDRKINITGMTAKGINENKMNPKEVINGRWPQMDPRTQRYPAWCSGRTGVKSNSDRPAGRHDTTGPKYFLTAVLLVRIYAYDLAKLTTREMMQWLQYLSYAGVEHVYVYDAYLFRNESQKEQLKCFIENGYVTYVDWSHRARPKYTIAGTQVSAYQNCINQFGNEYAWQTAIDIDEYPFCPNDRESGFLVRAVQEIARSKPSVGEISMQNYLYLGKPAE
ncbi:uncharacterized protein LOC110988940 [Acanthaster planci]|uniref:Glycosyltransferase family 92 protein n=1 Tax=Acanthaster planci TaxID=133434 RepID=A0A8B7ZU67_ACAPL|nr:uncharacterized protein LOC110988940 [Acanthaster planci]XP_022108628.1 uncharacterized protein LOC110988940 [Acanthaster planci]